MTNHTPRRACRVFLFAIALLLVGALAALAWRFGADTPVDYAGIEDHFKYGSTGGERESGFPYWIWKALPRVCEDKLPDGKQFPGREYQALGFLYEGERDLPVGMSKRRHMGLERVFLNCAVCHTSTVRDSSGSAPRIITGMPANTVDLMTFEKFMFACAKDEKFSPDRIIPEVQRLGGRLDLLDRYLVYPLAIYLMRDRLLMLESRFAVMLSRPDWGPGRVDTFGSAKALFNFPVDQAPDSELIGVTDFPSIWLQGPRKDKQMQLHWDGNNTKVEERNRSAAFGTGATPPTLDRDRIKRIEDWLLTREPPAYPYPIDQTRAAKGAALYKQYCASCHGASGRNFDGGEVGSVTPIGQIGTDRRRLDSYTYDLAVNQNLLYAGTDDPDERFSHFRKTFGYANMPLDGLWLRAPYLHNGSVPTLRDLLEPSPRRPKTFHRGYDVYDRDKVGFVSTVAEEKGRRYFAFDTAVPGNSNRGHEGARYGTELPAEEKAALVEYLKTF
ncbi:MAG: c-type cytochrome [Nitrospiraceae bacterium]